MAAGDKVAKVLLQYEIQKQKLAELRAANAAVKQDFDALGTTTAKAGDRAREFTTAMQEQRERLSKTREEAAKLRGEFLGLDTSLKKSSDGSVSLAGNLAKVREELEKAQKVADDVAQPRDSRGRFLPKIRGGGGGVDGEPTLEDLLGLEPSESSSGGKRNTFGLRTAGRELKALPAVQIPGLPVSTDAIGKISQLLGTLNPVAIAAGAGIGLATLALSKLTEQAKAAKEAADGELASRRRAIELITTGSKEDIQARINELDAKRKANQAAADDANRFLVTLRSDTVRQYGLTAATVSELNSTLGTGAGELSAAKDNADKANASLNDTSTELQLLQQQSGLTAQTTDDLIAKEKALTEVRSKLANLSSNASDLSQILNLEATGTDVNSVQELADAKRRDIEVSKFYQKAAEDLAKTLEVGSDGYKEATAEAEKYRIQVERDTNFIARLSQGTFELVGARQKELETVGAVKKFNDERTKDTDEYLAKITDIETKNAEKLVDLANKKADAEEAALGKLNDKIASLGVAGQRAVEDASLKASRDAADQQQKYQLAEAKAARDHANTLLKIQQEANDKADDLIAKRDFTGLLRLRQDTTRSLQAENDKYSESEQDRVDQAKQEHDARLLQYAREAQDRQTKYNRDLQDARSQYNKELSDANAKYNKGFALQQAAGQTELNLAQSKYNAQQQLLQQSIQTELSMINMGNVARALALKAGNEMLLQQAQQFAQGNFGGSTNGISANTNNVNNSKSVGAMTFNISGSNANGVARAVNTAVRSQLAYLLN